MFHAIICVISRKTNELMNQARKNDKKICARFCPIWPKFEPSIFIYFFTGFTSTSG